MRLCRFCSKALTKENCGYRLNANTRTCTPCVEELKLYGYSKSDGQALRIMRAKPITGDSVLMRITKKQAPGAGDQVNGYGYSGHLVRKGD